MMDEKSIPKIYKDILWRKDGSKNDIISLANYHGGPIFFLNRLGGKILLLCNGKHKIIDIINKINFEFPDIDPEIIHRDVTAFLNNLIKNQIIEIVQND